jgi:hypothetical protein
MRVVITNMHTGKRKVEEFLCISEAKQYFREWCDEHDYPYNEESTESGGVGFNYRIEIVED